MTINFNHVIAHNIQKETGKDIENTIILDDCFNIADQKTKKLAQSIYDSFGKPSNRPDIGQFKDKSNRGEFATECCNYAEKITRGEKDFIGLTKKFVEVLKSNIENNKAIIGGYIVCIHYTDPEKGDFILVAVIRDEEKLVFTTDLKLQETATINTSKLRLAFKITLEGLKEFNLFEQKDTSINDNEDLLEEEEKEQYNFLYVVGTSDRDKTEYFAQTIGYTKGKNSKKSTESLFVFIEDKFSSNSSLANKIEEAKDKTANFFAEKKGRAVTLEDLQTFYRSEFGKYIENEIERDKFFELFVDEMASDNYGIPYTFVGHKNTYEKQTQITIKNDSYELKLRNARINSDDKNAEIYWNKEEEYITIRVNVTEEILAQLVNI